MEETEVKEINIKSISNEKIVFVYDNFKRFLILLIHIFIILLGVSLVSIGHWFTVCFGILLIVVFLEAIINIVFFKSLVLDSDYVIKNSYFFGSKKINFQNLEVAANKRVWTGTVFFRDKSKSFFSRQVIQLEIFPIGNEGFKKIRKILINKKIIKGDENGWKY